MLFATGSIIRLYAQFTASKLGKTALAVTVKVDGPGNTAIGAGNLTLTEIDSTNQPGWWEVQIAAAATGTEGAYKATFHTADSSVDQQDLAALGYAYGWINAAATSLTLASPVSASGNVTLRKGNDYFNADGRAIQFTISGGPSLVGASVVFVCSNLSINKAGTIAGNVATFEFASTDTTGLAVGEYAFSLVFTLSNTHVVTLVTGMLIVVAA